MATKIIRADNAKIINAVRSNASLDYQQRINPTSKANLSATLQQLQDYPLFYNEFINVLVNRIGLTQFNTNRFENRLKPLKLAMLSNGAIMQEIGANLLEEEEYDPNDTNVFSAQKPDVAVDYHELNRRARFDMRLNEDLLNEAFIQDGALSTFMNTMLDLPTQSDEWNEYLYMMQLLKIYDDVDGFANYQVPDIATAADKEQAGKDLTTIVREMYLTLKGFYRSAYNPRGMQTVSRELILLATPPVMANLDVNVLSAAYHLDKAEFMADRTIVVDDFGIDGAQCALVDAEFYRCADTKVKLTNIYNPRADEWVYYLHHWGIYSVSRQRNALMFSAKPDTIIIPAPVTLPVSVSAELATPVAGNAVLTPGAEVQLKGLVTYDDDSTDTNLYWLLTGSTETAPSTGDPVVNVIMPDSGTYVDRAQMLHVSKLNNYTTITATAVSGDDGSKLASITLTQKAVEAGGASAQTVKVEPVKAAKATTDKTKA